MASRPKVLVIGAGLTGSLIAHTARKRELEIDLVVWDKARGCGGRAATKHAATGHQFDLGLQYLTSDLAGTLPVLYRDLAETGLIAPLPLRDIGGLSPKFRDASKQNFCITNGASSLCAHFLGGSDVQYNANVSSIDMEHADGTSGWLVRRDDGVEEWFNAVVLTTPVPQFLSICGYLQHSLDSELRARLERVEYSSRWALAVSLPPAAWEQVERLDWTVRYVSKEEDGAICYLSFDERKRGVEARGVCGPSLVVHASVPWSLENSANVEKMEEDGDLSARVKEDLLKRTRGLIPEVMEGHVPVAHVHKWRFSQVHRPFEHGSGATVACTDPPMILAGDGMIGSNFDNCVRSAEQSCACLAAAL